MILAIASTGWLVAATVTFAWAVSRRIALSTLIVMATMNRDPEREWSAGDLAALDSYLYVDTVRVLLDGFAKLGIAHERQVRHPQSISGRARWRHIADAGDITKLYALRGPTP